MHKSNDLFETAKKYIPGGVNSPVRAFRSVGGTPFFTKRAEGPFLYTADDERLTDFVSAHGVPHCMGTITQRSKKRYKLPWIKEPVLAPQTLMKLKWLNLLKRLYLLLRKFVCVTVEQRLQCQRFD